MSAPLDGLLVVDRSRAPAGSHATTMLADLGARVSKVEAPADGDGTRGWGPPFRLVVPGVLESQLDFTAAAASAAPHTPPSTPAQPKPASPGSDLPRGQVNGPTRAPFCGRSHFEWSN
jgi:hypothetical protein